MANDDLSTIDEGEGRPLVFLHGYLANKESFLPQIAFFRSRRRVIAFDLPGFGQAIPLPAPWSVDDYADFVSERLRGVGGYDILAHSFGARIALKLAARGTEPIGGMLLAGAAGIRPKRTFAYRRKVAAYKILKHFVPREKLDAKYGSSDYRALSPLMKESFKKIVAEDLTGILPRVRVPTLLVFGENDAETPLWMAEKLRRGIEGSALVVLPGAGHFCFLDLPARFNAVAGQFFG